MEKRTDTHRKSVIVPADYEHVLHYNLATTFEGWPIPPFGVNCGDGSHAANDSCCVVNLQRLYPDKVKGSLGKCTVCGARFIYGAIWKHVPTGEYIHLGHICCSKYGLIADRADFDAKATQHRNREVNRLFRELNAPIRDAFMRKHSGLKEAFENCSHNIVLDIKSKFEHNNTISDKQVALVLKLWKEATSKTPENYVQAPIGTNISFEGEIVSIKGAGSYYGYQVKMTVKVFVDSGCWLAWGTCPLSILGPCASLVGRKVRVTANLQAGRDNHFVFMKYPKAEFVE
jgi:hypothetical protein